MPKNQPRRQRRKTVRTTVSIPVDSYGELERIAGKQRVSIAWVIRAAVEAYLNEQNPLFEKR